MAKRDEMAPIARMRRALLLLPPDAFSLEGMFHTRADVEKWLEMNEFEILLSVLGGIGDQYESDRERLPASFWSELQLAAEEVGLTEVLRAERTHLAPETVDSSCVRQAGFLAAVEAGRFTAMKEAGQPPVEIGVEAIRAGASDVDAVRLLRGLFGFELERAVSIHREAQGLVGQEGGA
ncbi:hypothetical protein OV208_28735 [Corallococcus sp. bb12-1]|uniref:hypothetical protein n=1 Tax=Corallococcus sp. bb12-1 TaxID=2996784 RepID=UPI00226EA019|nr:hypothetical protein [Corallococcus sp. bb12-1]MCY1045337.1 hypothetical protein [Corallococcus sp. bb12-1]